MESKITMYHKRPVTVFFIKKTTRHLKTILLVAFLFSPRVIFCQADSALLYAVSRNDLPGYSYLFGTEHGLPDSLIFNNKAFRMLLLTVAAFSTETEIQNNDEIAAYRGHYDSGENIEKYFSQKDFAFLIREFEYYTKQPFSKYIKYYPLALVDLINYYKKIDYVEKNPFAFLKSDTAGLRNYIVKTTDGLHIYKPRYTLDVFIQQLSQIRKVPLIGLETYADQQNYIVKQMPLQEQAIRAIAELKGVQTYDIEKAINCYYQQDLPCICAIGNKATYQNVGDTTLLIDRNQRWLPKIENAIHQQPTLIAVGAGHLCGTKSVISLLRNKGYIVRPINY